MKPQWYIDIRVAAGVNECGPSGTAISALATFMRVVHGAAAARQLAFATAFPEMRCGRHAHPGTVLRLFTQEREHSDALADAIETNAVCALVALVSRVRPVPEGIAQSISYRRVRTPSRKSAMQVSGEARRLANMQRCDALPYLRVHSRSTGQRFSLRVEPTLVAAPPSASCEPDSFGFSVRDRPFALPLMPVQPAPWDVLRDEAREAAFS